jgi:hypothetical protein
MRRIAVLATAFMLALPAAAQSPVPPPQAANAGFTNVLFNSDFSRIGSLSGTLSCAGTPQTAPWKQGLWWEGQNNPAGVAPCSQIFLTWDPVVGHQVLDLRWLASQTDTYNHTTIETFPLNTFPPHFAFRHGYVEVVARETPWLTGVWPAIWMWGDNELIGVNTPPFNGEGTASEMDIMEAWGPAMYGGGMDADMIEYYSTKRGQFLYESYPPPVDITQNHIYGWLWASDNQQWQGGYVCAYIDNVQKGCFTTTSATEDQAQFLILSMGTGCYYNFRDRSCLGGLQQADLLVSRVTVWGQ